MVDAVHLEAHTGARVLACTERLAESLEAHWNAYATRRGPVAYERNALKLAYLLAGGQRPEEADEAVTEPVGERSAWMTWSHACAGCRSRPRGRRTRSLLSGR